MTCSMDSVKRNIVFISKIADDTTCNSNTHPKDIDDDKQLVLHPATKSDQ